MTDPVDQAARDHAWSDVCSVKDNETWTFSRLREHYILCYAIYRFPASFQSRTVRHHASIAFGLDERVLAHPSFSSWFHMDARLSHAFHFARAVVQLVGTVPVQLIERGLAIYLRVPEEQRDETNAIIGGVRVWTGGDYGVDDSIRILRQELHRRNHRSRAQYVQSGAPGFFAHRLLEPSLAEHIGAFLTPLISAPHLTPSDDAPFPSELRLPSRAPRLDPVLASLIDASYPAPQQQKPQRRRKRDDDETDSPKRPHL